HALPVHAGLAAHGVARLDHLELAAVAADLHLVAVAGARAGAAVDAALAGEARLVAALDRITRGAVDARDVARAVAHVARLDDRRARRRLVAGGGRACDEREGEERTGAAHAAMVAPRASSRY